MAAGGDANREQLLLEARAWTRARSCERKLTGRATILARQQVGGFDLLFIPRLAFLFPAPPTFPQPFS